MAIQFCSTHALTFDSLGIDYTGVPGECLLCDLHRERAEQSKLERARRRVEGLFEALQIVTKTESEAADLARKILNL